MRFYGPMGFARCVVCSARDLSLSFILSRIRLSTCLVCVTHRNTHVCTHTHRGKVPTESREESKRRPCPLQTSSSSFSSCFSPVSSRLCSFFFSLSFFLCLSLLLSSIEPSSGSFDWRARAEEGRRGEEKERERENKRKRMRRPGGKEKEERDLRGVDEVRGGPSFRGTVRNG